MSLDDLKEYRKYLAFDNQKSIVNDFKIDNNVDISNYIYKNIDKMDDVERRMLLARVLDNEKIRSELLKYELRYLHLGIKIDTFDELIIFMRKSFKRYHMKVGGHLCEDTEWSEHDHTSIKYPLKRNEYIFDNSIKRVNRCDSQINKYITDLLHFFNNHISKKLYITYRSIEYTDEIYWMVFKIKIKRS